MNYFLSCLKKNIFGIVLSFVFTFLLVFSLDFSKYRALEYNMEILPAEQSRGPVTVVMYGTRSFSQVKDILVIPAGWEQSRFEDGVRFVAWPGAKNPLKVSGYSEEINLTLVKSSSSGVAIVSTNDGLQTIDLYSENEDFYNLKIGGPRSVIGGKKSPPESLSLSVARIALVFAILISVNLGVRTVHRMSKRDDGPSKLEIVYYLGILIITPGIVLLSFYPSNAAFDSSLQWMESLSSGPYTGVIGIFATMVMKIFSGVCSVPSLLMFWQIISGAVAISLILYEMRMRGVTKVATYIFVLIFAFTPAYPFIITYLSKDALTVVGLLYFTWSVLFLTRDQFRKKWPCAVVVFSAIFVACIRINYLPPMICAVVFVSLVLFVKKDRLLGSSVLISFFLIYGSIAFLSQFLDRDGPRVIKTNNQTDPESRDVGGMTNVYLYHLYASMKSGGATINSEDESPFLTMAPESIWKQYDCQMVDTTVRSLADYWKSVGKVTRPAASRQQLFFSVLKMILGNPSIALSRQACITELLWYIGYKQKPFQVTVTRGYDSVMHDFIEVAGQNRPIIFNEVRTFLNRYVDLTERPSLFWIFWRPAFVLSLFVFLLISSIYLKQELGVLIVITVPLVSTLVLMVILPFPAFRYQYPSLLVLSLVSLIAFRRADLKLGVSKS